MAADIAQEVRPEGTLFEAPAGLVISRAVAAIIEQANRMEAECSHPPCVHAQGLRLALAHVRAAGECSECGSDPGGHMGGCSVWQTYLNTQDRERLRARAAREPLEVDLSDQGDEFCAGFLAGQVHALDTIEWSWPR